MMKLIDAKDNVPPQQFQSLAHSNSRTRELTITTEGYKPRKKIKLENETLYAKIKFQDMELDTVKKKNSNTNFNNDLNTRGITDTLNRYEQAFR